MKLFLLMLVILPFFLGCANLKNSSKSKVEIMPVSKVDWQKLNPARGDKSPQAGTLWGDRKAKVPTGFLAKFVDGFSSPPHIHNVTYRGVVISGEVHNDDPRAAKMWMPTGSYWTQPAGESHITAAKGKENIALIEIDDGPYLVKPSKKAFDNGERPFNIHAKNVIWTKGMDGKYTSLWKNAKGEVTGTLISYPKHIHLKASDAKVVVIRGTSTLSRRKDLPLKPGSLISLDGKSTLHLTCSNDSDCLVYLKSTESFKL